MTDYDKELGEAKEKLAKAQSRILGVYLEKMRGYYQTLGVGDNRRTAIIMRLENLVQHMSEETAESQRYPMQWNSAFDNKRASEIRKKEGLSIADLAEKISGKRLGSSYQMLRFYEHSERRPANPPQGEVCKKYLAWLKEKGYNPYNL